MTRVLLFFNRLQRKIEKKFDAIIEKEEERAEALAAPKFKKTEKDLTLDERVQILDVLEKVERQQKMFN